MLREWKPAFLKFNKKIGHYIPIAHCSHKIYTLLYIQTKTTTACQTLDSVEQFLIDLHFDF